MARLLIRGFLKIRGSGLSAHRKGYAGVRLEWARGVRGPRSDELPCCPLCMSSIGQAGWQARECVEGCRGKKDAVPGSQERRGRYTIWP